MARSNHHYYNICHDWQEIEEDGYCPFHRPGAWSGRAKTCTPERTFLTRRGEHRRHRRFPGWSWKSWCGGPPIGIKKIWRRQARARMKQELQQYGEVLFDAQKWLAGQYAWWS